jgi:hypothetical protein
VEEHLDLLKRKVIQSDMSSDVDEYLLSVNNCLSISESYSGSFYRHPHQREAHPLDFYQGYVVFDKWKYIIRAFIKIFFEESDESAKQTVELIFEKYKSQIFDKSDSGSHDGHLIQICIPKEHAERFAHTSFAYGMPASIYEIYNAHRPQFMAQSSFEGGAPPNAKRQLSFQEIMSSKHMGRVQSRIIAHPNLFLQHGAFAEVFLVSVGFDRKKFRTTSARSWIPSS